MGTANKLTSDQRVEIKELYEHGVSTKVLSEKYQVSQQTIYKTIRKAGGQVVTQSEANRRYKVNHNFFSTIETEEQAYLLGFILADGCITGHNKIQIALDAGDHNHLEMIRNLLDTDKPLYYYNGQREAYSLIICSDQMTSDLNNLGIMRQKTFTATLPEVKPELVQHLVRGYFDGDGCISGGIFSLTGNLNVLESIQEILMTECSLRKTKLVVPHRDRNKIDNIRTLSYGGRNQLQRIYAFLYNGATVYLLRKKDKFTLEQCPLCG